MANVENERMRVERHYGNVRVLRFLLPTMASLLIVLAIAIPVAAQEQTQQQSEIEDSLPDGDGSEDSSDTDVDTGEVDSEGVDSENVNELGGVVLPSLAGSSCATELAIVVASDVAAQSDIYSAVTLAGVLDTDCIILAGARDAVISANQRARLNSAQPGGWIVGGSAAVPPWKTAGRSMKRIAGTDRWHTARLVGAVAADPDADIARLHAAIVAWNPLTDETDCSGSVAIVVASDVLAQSDIYSAVTLAGVLDTDCIVFAGSRDATMPGDQRARLDRARSGGWIVGGSAAVPPSKTAGRSMKRIAGADRWHTARLVGAVAADPNIDVGSLIP